VDGAQGGLREAVTMVTNQSDSPGAAHGSKHLHLLKVPVELHAKQRQPMLLLQDGVTQGITDQEGRTVSCINSFACFTVLPQQPRSHVNMAWDQG